MRSSTPGHRIPRHCTIVDINCYLSPYDSAEPFSQPRARDNGEHARTPLQIEITFDECVFGVLELQLSLSRRINGVTLSSVSQ